MQRDFDLVREILLDLQSKPAGQEQPSDLSTRYDDDVIKHHLSLMIDAGLLKGKVLKTMRGIASVHIIEVTWAGHDFLDAAKEDTLWAKAKALITEKGSAMSLETLTGILKAFATSAIGF